jgi:uncharacterized membrane protein
MTPSALIPHRAPPGRLRQDLREGREPSVVLRRAIIALSLAGTACMAVTTLFQVGLIRHLKDPPIEGFHSDKVNGSDLAYSWGMPDSPLSIVSHAVSIALAAFGGAHRARRQPLVPIAATLVAAPAAATAARYLFHDMPVREKAWCPYCIADALAHMAVLGMTLHEASRAIRSMTLTARTLERRRD